MEGLEDDPDFWNVTIDDDDEEVLIKDLTVDQGKWTTLMVGRIYQNPSRLSVENEDIPANPRKSRKPSEDE